METTGRISLHKDKAMIGMEQFRIRPLCRKDIEVLGDLYFPWSTKEETIAKWTRYLEEQQQGIRKALIVYGITYKHVPVVAGEKYPVDDDLILWLTKHLSC